MKKFLLFFLCPVICGQAFSQLSPKTLAATRTIADIKIDGKLEEAAWKDGILRTTLFEPFEIMRHSNQESSRKEKDNGGSGRDLGIWLPK